MGDAPVVHWSEDGEARSARWRSERGAPPPTQVVIADDRMTADEAYGLACQGIALLWRGDFQNARQMLTAMAQPRRSAAAQAAQREPPPSRAEVASRRLQPRAPGARAARAHARHAADPARRRLRDSAAARARHPRKRASKPTARRRTPRWSRCGSCWASSARTSGAARASSCPRSGSASIRTTACSRRFAASTSISSPRRRCPRPPRHPPSPSTSAPGTGVLAAVLARRGIQRVVATDHGSARARLRAREPASASASAATVDVVQADLFPEGRAAARGLQPALGSRRARARRSSTASTIPRAAC